MDQLLPRPHADDTEPVDLPGLYAVPAPPPGRRVFLRTNFIATLDGAAQGPDGRSGSLNNATDRALFALQRALTDVILVGAGTVRDEGYGPAAVAPDHLAARLAGGHDQQPPPIAVVSASLDLGEAILADPRTIVVTTGRAPAARRAALAERVDVAVCGDDELDLSAVLDALADRGHRSVLCEGGPTLVGRLTAAGLVDEVCLTIAPLLLGGDAARMLRTPALDPMPRWRPASLVIDDDGYLFGRWTAVRTEDPRR
jgi:riboflavin biosynthesis pyrimidine reductase